MQCAALVSVIYFLQGMSCGFHLPWLSKKNELPHISECIAWGDQFEAHAPPEVGLRARARGGGRGERPLQVPASGFDLLAIDACKVCTRKRAQFCRQLNKILPKILMT